MATSTRGYALVLLSTLTTSTGNALLKHGSSSLSVAHPLNAALAAGIALYGLSAVLFVLALRHGDLSTIYPIYALDFIWVSLIAMRVFGEPMPPLKWAGILCILGGIAAIGKGGSMSQASAGIAQPSPVEDS
ncbi:hypothetical protein J4439_07095 [Candidatus Woesearchaeota archaeon]|nr:hypothetical protein [Candidatus Woesearchaeota archaeon]